MIRILFQGDSITDGGRLRPIESRWDLNHQIGHSYVYPIVGELGRRSPGKYVCINRGISGDTVAGIGNRWQTDTLDEHPDILSILLGINGNGKLDGQYPEGVEAHLSKFDADYRTLLDSARAQNPDLQLIIMEPFALPVGNVKEHFEAFMAVFSRKQAIIRRIAEDYGAIFIPIQKRLEALVAETAPILIANGSDTDPNAYWMWDGIHPTESLHHYMAELWLEAAAPLL